MTHFKGSAVNPTQRAKTKARKHLQIPTGPDLLLTGRQGQILMQSTQVSLTFVSGDGASCFKKPVESSLRVFSDRKEH